MLKGLAQLLRDYNRINVFQLNPKPEPKLGETHWIRVFPHGCCFLMTDSLFLKDPYAAWRILKWFREEKLVNEFPYTWKVAMRKDAINWLMDITVNLMVDQLSDDPQHPEYLGLWSAALELFKLIYDHPDGPLVDEDDDTLPTDEAPVKVPYTNHMVSETDPGFFEVIPGTTRDGVYTPDLVAAARNDQGLVEWFGEQSTMWIYDYRRFTIITGFEDNNSEGFRDVADKWSEAYGHVEVLSIKSFIRGFGVAELPRYPGDGKGPMPPGTEKF